MRIAVVAPSNTLPPEVPPRVQALVAARYGPQAPEIVFHPQCFLSSGHFAGPDASRTDALVEVANDPSVDAVWLARGGYGANRIAERAIARMSDAARDKLFLGYSDGGFLLAGLLAKGVGRPVHAPMPSDILRGGGDAAVVRALDWMIAALSPRLAYYFGSLPLERTPEKAAVFNLTVLSSLLGTPLEFDFAGRVLIVEEVDEEMYRIDRMLFHVTSSAAVRRCSGLRLGRCAPIPPNIPDFGEDVEHVARRWCSVSNINWLGRADIGHDVDNNVVPFD